MDVYDFLFLALDGDFVKVEIYDNDTNQTIFRGNGKEAKQKFGNWRVGSWNLTETKEEICLNVNKPKE